MGRLMRRFIRSHEVTVTHKLTVNKVQELALTGNIVVLNPIAELAAGVVLTGSLRSAWVESNLNDASQVTVYWEALYVHQYAHAGALIDTINSVHINNYIQGTIAGSYYFMRLTENAAVTVTAAIFVSIGAAANITNLLYLGGTKTAWSPTLNPPGSGPPAGGSGRIAVNVGGLQRYIQLFV